MVSALLRLPTILQKPLGYQAYTLRASCRSQWSRVTLLASEATLVLRTRSGWCGLLAVMVLAVAVVVVCVCVCVCVCVWVGVCACACNVCACMAGR